MVPNDLLRKNIFSFFFSFFRLFFFLCTGGGYGIVTVVRYRYFALIVGRGLTMMDL